MENKVLLLGGTGEAFLIAQALKKHNIAVVTSMAGVTDSPRTPVGEVRFGGFGGAEGLVAYLVQNRIRLLVDATHPFATKISANALRAATKASIPRLGFYRKGWDEAGYGKVTLVKELVEAVEFLGKVNLLALGSNTDLGFFFRLKHKTFVWRSFNKPPTRLPSNCHYERTTRTATLQEELAVLEKHKVDVLVCRNSGGEDAKLKAAQLLNISIVMEQRPPPPPPPLVSDVDAVVRWVRGNLSQLT